MPQRLTFLTDIVTPYMVAVLQALSELVELTVLFCSESGTRAMPWGFPADLGFRHEVLGGLTLRRSHPDATDYYLSPRILHALVRSRPEAVVVGGYSIPTVYASGCKAITGARLLIHSDGTSRSEHQLSGVQRAARAVLLRVADCCVANSEPAAARFIELGMPPARVFRAPHSTDLRRHRAIAARRRYEPSDRVRLLTVGRLIRRKGVDRLLVAFAEARRELPSLELSIVGNGPQEAELRALARELGVEDAVSFDGFVGQDDLPALYAAADVFLFPTLDDPFGLVLLEAAAAGLCLIASPHGGATLDLIRDGENGLVADPLDCAALAESLVRVGRDPALRERLGRAAHRTTLERTPEHAARGYVDAATAALAARAA